MKYFHKVPNNYSKKERISDYAIEIFPLLPTKSSVKKAIKKKLLLINNLQCTTATFVKSDDIITYISEETQHHKIFKLKLEVIYEDDYIAIINKPAGFSVSGNKFKTIANALSFNLKKSNKEDALPYPLPVHRLDNQTSGLLIIAKTKQARITLGNQFEQKEIQKKYHAVVVGKTLKNSTITFPIENKNAFTEYELIKTEPSLRNKYLSLIKLTPKTGRTHQLRIHCEKSGFPILGLTFNHPITKNKLNITIPYPNKFDIIINREKERFFLKGKL